MARGKGRTVGGAPAQGLPTVPTSGGYGSGAAQRESLKQVPLPDNAAMQQIAAPQREMIPPGSLEALNAPSGMPEDPITNGASFGPGQHLGELDLPQQQDIGPQVDAQFMSSYLPMLESAASAPGSSFAMRAWVRKLRGSLPPDFEPVIPGQPET